MKILDPPLVYNKMEAHRYLMRLQKCGPQALGYIRISKTPLVFLVSPEASGKEDGGILIEDTLYVGLPFEAELDIGVVYVETSICPYTRIDLVNQSPVFRV